LPQPRTISGRIFVLALAAICLLVIALSFGFSKICDGRETVILHLSESHAARVAEVRCWSFPMPGTDSDKVRDMAEAARHVGGDFQCDLPFSYEERGWLFIRRIDTAPLPREFTIWLHFTNGAWTMKTVPTPHPNANGVRELTINESIVAQPATSPVANMRQSAQ
jgi:hypothetical protein